MCICDAPFDSLEDLFAEAPLYRGLLVLFFDGQTEIVELPETPVIPEPPHAPWTEESRGAYAEWLMQPVETRPPLLECLEVWGIISSPAG